MKMHRLIHILLLLEGQKKVTAKELALRLETSIRTIYRDIEDLCEAGIPVCTESGPNGGISLMEGYHTQIEHLDQEDIIYLYLNGLGVKAERSNLLSNHHDLTLKKLTKNLPETEIEKVQVMVERFVVDSNPWWGTKQSLSFVDSFVEAVFKQYKLCITYEKVNHVTSSRIIRPYGIVIKDNIWYLVGYCETSSAVRTFRCDRIVECKRLGETFVYPLNFELKTYFDSSLKEFKASCSLIEKYFVTIQCATDALRWLDGLEYKILEKQEEQYIICVNFYGLDNALHDYWNILMESRVLKPQELAKAVEGKLKETLKFYSV